MGDLMGRQIEIDKLRFLISEWKCMDINKTLEEFLVERGIRSKDGFEVVFDSYISYKVKHRIKPINYKEE